MDEGALKSFLEETFAWLHSHPELSYEEYETTAKLKELLAKEDIRLLELPLATGAVAEIGSKDGPIVAVRADIDALPGRVRIVFHPAEEAPGGARKSCLVCSPPLAPGCQPLTTALNSRPPRLPCCLQQNTWQHWPKGH